MNPLNKPYLLFAVPRSGSTPIFEAMAEICHHLYGYENLEEYLNWTNVEVWEENGAIKFLKKEDAQVWPSLKGMKRVVTNRAERVIEIEARVKLLMKYPNRYTMKVLSNFFNLYNPNEFTWLARNYQWFFLERKDLLEQLLSNLIVAEKGVWYEDIPTKVPVGCLVAKRASFDHFCSILRYYDDIKKIMKPKRILYYEDYCQMGPRDYFNSLGFKVPDTCTFHNALSVPIQNGEGKLEMFANKDEILKWFKELSN